MTKLLRLTALLALLIPTVALGQTQIPAAFQGMTQEQIQQALEKMSQNQIRGLPTTLKTSSNGPGNEQVKKVKEPPDPAAATRNDPLASPQPTDDAAPSEERSAGSSLEIGKERDTRSSIEMLYQTKYNSQLAKNISQFGYDIFRSKQMGLPSRLAVPDTSYILGPGDTLRIRIWGSGLDAEYTGAIEKDGTINVPQIGIVSVAGLKYGSVEGVIREAAEKYVQGINISVSLDQLRSMEIYVVGSVRQPGIHLVPAFSTVLGGLLAGGGVGKSGSLRQIKLFRNGNLVKAVDIYDLMLKGTRESDVILEDRDVIFVPRIGPTMAVAGAVAEPGIYELSVEDNVGEVLALAGNILPQSYTGRMHLKRFENNDEFIVQDIDTTASTDNWRKIQIQNGDFLEVQLLTDVQQPMRKNIKLTGHVWTEDVFRYRQGLKLSDILTSAELLKPEAMTDYALLNRYDPVTTRMSTHKFPLKEVFSGAYDAELQPLDEIRILSRAELQIQETVEITGAVWRPLKTIFRPQLSLKDLLAIAGGLRRDQAFVDYGYLYRYDPDILDFRMERIDLNAILSGEKRLILKPFDRVRILSRDEFDMQYEVTLAGAVWKPGKFDFNQGITLADLINLGGGVKFGADTTRITLSSKRAGHDRMTADHRIVDLTHAGDTVLNPFDYVFIPQIKDAGLVREVTLEGEVRFPGTYTIREGERISELIERAGGYTREAYFYGIEYRSASARAIQQKSIDKLLDDLEIRAKMFMSEQAQTGASAQDIEAAKTAQIGMDAFIAKLRTVRATGRVAIQVTALASFKGSNWDFVLEDGDSIRVPKQPNFVSVVGAVYSPSAYMYQPELTLADYLKQSGGPTKSADNDYMYVLKANGEVFSQENNSSFGNRFMKQNLMPGDAIVVPEDLERVPYLRLTKDLADIVFKIATTAGVAIAAL